MLNVLLIDDDEMEYVLIRRMLEDCYDRKFTLRYASSLEKGLSILKNKTLDVILLDDKLNAGRTSKDSVPAIRKAVENVPMIVISSNIDAAYLRDRTILDVYDIVDKYHLRQKIQEGLLGDL